MQGSCAASRCWVVVVVAAGGWDGVDLMSFVGACCSSALVNAAFSSLYRLREGRSCRRSDDMLSIGACCSQATRRLPLDGAHVEMLK